MTFKCNTRNIMERPAVVSKNGEKGWKKIIDFCSIFEIDIYNNFCFSINSVYIYTHTHLYVYVYRKDVYVTNMLAVERFTSMRKNEFV